MKQKKLIQKSHNNFLLNMLRESTAAIVNQLATELYDEQKKSINSEHCYSQQSASVSRLVSAQPLAAERHELYYVAELTLT